MSELRKLAHTFGALADLGQEISESNNLELMARTSLHLVLGSLAIMRGVLVEFDGVHGYLNVLAARGIGENKLDPMPLADESAALLAKDGISAIDLSMPAASNSVYGSFHSFTEHWRTQIVIPLVVRANLLGVLFLGEKASGKDFSDDDREILCAMARHIAVGLQEHRHREELQIKASEIKSLYDGMRAIYKDTVRAFAAAIDCKDKYTQGHSERVGRYSEIIARELGWNEDEVEGIAVAGYLHDIGKLVVDRDIINAPYKIDAKQSSELNRHPAAGYEILSPIRHPYADIPLMARHHHERLDGRGYPDGLTAEEIPIGVRIVSLADSFDAMTTDRPYRRRRTIDEVIIDLRKNTGKQFSVEVVIALCRALLYEVTGVTTDRKMIKMLGRDYLESPTVAPLLAELIDELSASPAAAVSA
jgi:hypothetical protein